MKVIIFLSLILGFAVLGNEPKADMGIMVGEVTSTQAVVQVRLNQPGTFQGINGKVEFRLKKIDNGKEILTQTVAAKAEYDFIARTVYQNLAANTQYVCNTTIISENGQKTYGPVARFRTLAGPKIDRQVSFVVVTGMNYAKFYNHHLFPEKKRKRLPPPYTGIDKHLGYPALETVLSLRPDFFVGTGDNVYYDSPDRKRAETPAEMRLKWHEQFSLKRYIDLFAEVPTYWEIDDHDYRINDGDNSGDYLPSSETGRRIMLEQLPIAAHEDTEALTYRTVRASKNLQVWFTENRMYRSDNKLADGPGKTIWGAKQKAWLKKTLLESDAKYKILVSPTPMIGPDDAHKIDNHCNTDGFQYERDEFFKWVKDNGLDKKGFFIACGDRHWQYHSISPEGIQEFSCGAFNDVNSRMGMAPGAPKSTDPDAKIRQVYSQKEPSGGFLQIKCLPAQNSKEAELYFNFYDEKGILLYQHLAGDKK